MSQKSYNFCNNCGKNGHIFQSCKHPITSIGIIVFKLIDNKIKYLMIKRKHSLGFVEFMRGKYPVNNYIYLINIFNEMSNEEKEKIKNSTFDELWNYLWGNQVGIQYRGEEKTSKEKYELLKNGISNKNEYNLETLLTKCNYEWNETEWGFPKGRRNYQEKDLNCALREFEEETGYIRSNIQLIQNISPYEEIFTGSNMKSYKHKYFLGYIDASIKSSNPFQETEVGDMKWLSYDECLEKIRPYNLEKITVLNKINNVLTKYRLY
jgi:ADP-ribose pyrophosphatase YjhB (NUDIX family)|uniref:Nudix hydrolase domain-containing protein n=1 Tax=viral metagenome TaxID=1070528 RepID=A0A6C0CI33_9ZZZZ